MNKCEIHMNVTCTFHSPKGATVIFGLFLVNRTICWQTNSQSSQFTDWSTCGL